MDANRIAEMTKQITRVIKGIPKKSPISKLDAIKLLCNILVPLTKTAEHQQDENGRPNEETIQQQVGSPHATTPNQPEPQRQEPKCITREDSIKEKHTTQ